MNLLDEQTFRYYYQNKEFHWIYLAGTLCSLAIPDSLIN